LTPGSNSGECAPSWQAMDPDASGHIFTAIGPDRTGRVRTWTWSFPVYARCREAQEIAATLKQALRLDSLTVTTCH
jgi:hypothetical protein